MDDAAIIEKLREELRELEEAVKNFLNDSGNPDIEDSDVVEFHTSKFKKLLNIK